MAILLLLFYLFSSSSGAPAENLITSNDWRFYNTKSSGRSQTKPKKDPSTFKNNCIANCMWLPSDEWKSSRLAGLDWFRFVVAIVALSTNLDMQFYVNNSRSQTIYIRWSFLFFFFCILIWKVISCRHLKERVVKIPISLEKTISDLV